MAGYSLRPLAELATQARGFFTQTIPGAIASVWANTFTVLGKVLALLGFETELRRRWLFDQIFASTADELWLERHGFELGLSRRPASAASGTITLDATPGLDVPAGLIFTRQDGLTYTTGAGATAAGNSVTLPLEADLSGSAGNLDPGATLALDPAQEVDGLGNQGIVDAEGLAGGADREPLETFRGRVLRRKRTVAQGGSRSDYATWVEEALGADNVAAVFVDSFANDARSVWVAFTVIDQPNGIPTDAQIAAVQRYVDDPVRRPVTARVFAVQLSLLPVPVQVQGLTPDTLDIRLSLEAELAAEFVDRGLPGKPGAAAIFAKSWLDEAISRAVGEDRHGLALPLADVSVPAGFLPVLGPVTYTD